MNYRRKRDGNEKAIERTYLDAGATYERIEGRTKGTPDAVVGRFGVTDLVEVKDPAGRDAVDPDQVTWHGRWRGSPVRVIRTREDVLVHLADMQSRARKSA